MSNIPTLLLVVDPKYNKFGYAWLDEFSRQNDRPHGKAKVRVPLADAERDREQIRAHILATIPAAT